MTVALDATYSLGAGLSGVGVYSREILFGLARAHPEAHFHFYYRPHRLVESFGMPIPENCRRRLLHELLGRPRADLFHGLNQRLPRTKLGLSVATFHDLFVLTGEYSSPAFRVRFTEQARDAAARADAIITVSEFTARQVVDLLGVPRKRITVVHHGVRLRASSGSERENVILHVGAIQRRKNIARLIEAFEAGGGGWELVLAGSAGFGAEEIMERVACSPCRNRIRVLNYVDTAVLESLYARARIFAFPSLDEGFGMPVLEAMASGVPVITSNRAALPEVAGEAALLVNPEETDDLREALNRLQRDEDLQRRLIRLGLARATHFTWERAVAQTWAVYQGLLGA